MTDATHAQTEPSLQARWRDQTAHALEWRSGDDPEPVLEALALTVALELTGELERAPRADREALRKLGQRALLQLGGQELDEDDLEALRLCAALARDGLRALSEPSGSAEPVTVDGADTRLLVPPSELVRLLRGELDGFAAASLVRKVRRSEAAMAELRTLLALRSSATASHAAASDRPLSLAAASASPVLDPARGRPVGTLATVGAEAVLFVDGESRRLAVYAEEPDALRLLAEELTTEDVREGYWVGRVSAGAVRLEAVLEIGDRTEPWVLDLDDLDS